MATGAEACALCSFFCLPPLCSQSVPEGMNMVPAAVTAPPGTRRLVSRATSPHGPSHQPSPTKKPPLFLH